jgi:RNA 3'-terminal phosphate cyclase (ATP)
MHVAERMAETAKKIIRKHLSSVQNNNQVQYDVQTIHETQETATGDGAGIIVIAKTTTGCLLAGSALGERGKSAEIVGQEAADSLVRDLVAGGCVDEYLQDQVCSLLSFSYCLLTLCCLNF